MLYYFYSKKERLDIMGPYTYTVLKIDGDYAILKRTDIVSEDTILVARALLPMETDEGIKLLWENFDYSVLD